MKNPKNTTLLSEINVTPFVDVMLVLLIIFMATAPMLQQGLKVDLPLAKSAGVEVSTASLILKITKDQSLYMGSQVIPLEELNAKLQAIFENKKEKAVYIQADKSVPYGIVAQTLGEIKASGIQKVSLITLTQ